MLFLVCCYTFATPINSGLLLWLDASDSSTVINDGSGYVMRWEDKSGNNYHATQSTSASRPTLNSNALNGKAAIRFDGSNDGMFISDSLYLTRSYTVFIVNQYYGSVQGRTLQSRDINWLAGLWAGNHGHYASGWVSNSSYNTAGTNTPWISEAIGYTSSSAYYANGQNYTVDSNPTGNPGKLALVGSGAYNEQSQADVAEILIYNRVLTTQERNAVGSYLATKYSMATSYVNVPEPATLSFALVAIFALCLKKRNR